MIRHTNILFAKITNLNPCAKKKCWGKKSCEMLTSTLLASFFKFFNCTCGGMVDFPGRRGLCPGIKASVSKRKGGRGEESMHRMYWHVKSHLFKDVWGIICSPGYNPPSLNHILKTLKSMRTKFTLFLWHCGWLTARDVSQKSTWGGNNGGGGQYWQQPPTLHILVFVTFSHLHQMYHCALAINCFAVKNILA